MNFNIHKKTFCFTAVIITAVSINMMPIVPAAAQKLSKNGKVSDSNNAVKNERVVTSSAANANSELNVVSAMKISTNEDTKDGNSDLVSTIQSLSILITGKSKYANIGISIANDYVNIRTRPNESSTIAGRLYKGCAATITGTQGAWVKVESEGIKGFIKSEYLAIGSGAEKLAGKYGTKTATVTATTLKVRKKASTNSTVITLIPKGESYEILSDKKDWIKIAVDDNTTGYVSKDFVDITTKFDGAVPEKGSTKTAGEKDTGSKASASEVRSDLVSFALKYVGNPYVWGGTSLTCGADCSGYVKSVFGHFGYSVCRTARDQATNGTSVSFNKVQKGDLIFYSHGKTVTHVAIYIGDGKVVHAFSTKSGIIVSNMYFMNPYCARRIIG